MSIVLLGSTSGSITLQEPAISGNTVLSLPATTGTVLTSASPSSDLPSSINGPSFSAWQSTLQSVSNATFTKIQFQTEEWDTANCFDSTTNFRFTPNVAGYYQVNCGVGYASGASTRPIVSIFKNGAEAKRIYDNNATSYTNGGSALISCNGTTDYIEIYAYQGSGSAQNTNNAQVQTFFQAFLARAT